MKKAYTILLYAICVIALAWTLPWLYDLMLPQAVSDPFVAYSPVSESLIVSEKGDGDAQKIFIPDGAELTREQRDSLLPQMYFTQLMARQAMPDSVQGVEMTVANLRHGQWVFLSSPRDVNRVAPRLYPMMESMPERFELEDPKEVFRLEGKMEFIDMATNEVNHKRTSRFTSALEHAGFKYPVRSTSANITSRKSYDEGYLLADNAGAVYHVKMQAGQPYVAKVALPDSVKAEHVFVLENPDHRLVGLMVDASHRLYAIEHDGYRAVPLPVGEFDTRTCRLTIIKDVFSWVVKLSDAGGSRWVVLDSGDYSVKATYHVEHPDDIRRKIASWIFPFVFTVADLDDCYVRPRISDVSWHALVLNAVLALIAAALMRRRGRRQMAIDFAATLVLGIYYFLPMALLRRL